MSVFDNLNVGDDIQAPAPSNDAINPAGEQTASPTGRIDYGQVADSLRQMPDVSQQKPSAAPPALPSSDADTSQPQQPVMPAAAPQTAQATPPGVSFKFGDGNAMGGAPAAPAPDMSKVFSDLDVAPPNMQSQNQSALNPPQPPAVQNYVQQEQANDDDIARHLFTPEQIAEFKANPVNLSNMGHLIGVENVLPGANLFSGFDKAEAANIAQKIKGMNWQDAMHSLTINEQQVFMDQMRQTYELKLRGFSPGFTGGATEAAYTLAQIPAWVTDFVASGGAATAAVGATGATGATAVAVGGAARLMTFFPTIENGYGDMRIANGINITDKGQMFIKDSVENPGTTFLKSAAYTSADIASQIYGGKAMEAVIKTPLISAVNALPVAIREGVYSALKAIQPSAQVSKVLTTAGWHGAVEQLGINRIDQILKATTDAATTPNFTTEDFMKEAFPTSRQMAIEAGLVVLPGAVSSALHAGTGILMQRGMPEAQAADTMNSMSQTEKETFVNNNLPLPKSDYPPVHEKPVMAEGSPDSKDAEDNSVINAKIAASQASNPPPVAEDQSGFNKAWGNVKSFWKEELYPQAVNDIEHIQNATAEGDKLAGTETPDLNNTRYTARMARNVSEFIRYNLQVNTAKFDENGNMVNTGKSYKAIVDDFDNMFNTTEPNMATRHDDLNKFEQAQRYFHEKEKGDAFVSDEQVQRSVDHMQHLSEKYGEDFSFFQMIANERRAFRNDMLQRLADSGLKSQQWVDDTIKENPFYTPLNRIVEEEGYKQSVSARGIAQDPNASRIGSMKQFKGSSLEEKNTMESDIKNSALILQKARVNQLLQDVARWRDIIPEVKVSLPRIIAKEVKVSYDPKLRAKLEATIEAFGNKIGRTSETLKVPGHKNVLGYYSPMEKLIMMKIGTTEGTLAHEVGHMLDTALDLKKNMLEEPGVRDELKTLAEDRLVRGIKLEPDEEGEMHFREEQAKQGKSKYNDYIKNDDEILANFYDTYVNSPEKLNEIAPKAKAAFEKIVDADPDLAFLKEIKPSTSRAEETIQKVVRDLDGEKGQFPFYENGQRKFLSVPDGMRKALEGMTPVERDMTYKYLKKPLMASKRVLQVGATSLPPFAIRHYMRNMYLANLNTGGKATPLDVLKGTLSVLGHTEDWKRWKAITGGFQSFMDLSDEGLNKSYTDMFKKPSLMTRLNPLQLEERMKEFADQPARLAVFNAMKRAGASDMEAGYASIEKMVDYNSGGSVSKEVNKYVAFFNTRLQHINTTVEAFKENPSGFTIRATAMLTVPQLVLTGYYLYAADDKTRQEYLDIPEWRRAMFMNVKVGDRWLPIPRPFLPGVIFGAIPEMTAIHEYNHYRPEAQSAWLSMASSLMEGSSPVSDISAVLPTPVKAFLENQTNYNFFMGRNIYSPDKDRLPASQRENTYTSETAHDLGAMFNVSPAKIDNTVADMSGNLGKALMQLSDKGIDTVRSMEGKPVAQKPTDIANNPLVGGLVERNPEGMSSESVQEFYNHYNEASEAHAGQKELQGADLKKFQDENRPQLSQYDALNSAHKELSDLNKQSKAIATNTNMDGDTKAAAMQRINEQISNVAKHANMGYANTTKRGN